LGKKFSAFGAHAGCAKVIKMAATDSLLSFFLIWQESMVRGRPSKAELNARTREDSERRNPLQKKMRVFAIGQSITKQGPPTAGRSTFGKATPLGKGGLRLLAPNPTPV
jgi:hypothetical protein